MQTLGLSNKTPESLVVYVETGPDRYVLEPEDEMMLEGETDARQTHFHVNICDKSIRIFTPLPVRVTINGKSAEPLWERSQS